MASLFLPSFRTRHPEWSAASRGISLYFVKDLSTSAALRLSVEMTPRVDIFLQRYV
jgi:hypothetical protein